MIPKTTLLLGLSMLAMATPAAARECVRSPGAVLELCVSVADGQALYAVMRGGTEVIAPSRLGLAFAGEADPRSEEHTSELQSLMRISYAVFRLKKKNEYTLRIR